MVIAAVVASLMFYFLIVRWYVPMMWDMPNWDRPLVFSRSWFHAAVWLTGIFLFLVAVIGLFRVSWWLSLGPFVLFFALIAKQRFTKESKVDATIKKVILLHYEVKQKGLPEQDTFKQIARQLAGVGEDDPCFDSRHEWTLEALIQYLILPMTGLWHYQTGTGMAGVADLAAMTERIRVFQRSFETLRAANEQRSAR